ncbi:Zinc finger CCCH domain-containing protein 38 [Vitis vinifera]|uniref:Zinc finger CCCH domain-containing protein 38 n=1 Tax=Vitis vinifera TaxID=29760 RepID=A0A438HLH7_VITVI|nr:Zinc finger CCCH domain-containing protein 38 [Vitis vinifera]
MSEGDKKEMSTWDLKQTPHQTSQTYTSQGERMLESLAWVENTGAYITRMSPGLDKWRQENLDHSRRESWSKTYRCFLSSLMTLGQLKPLDVAKSRSPSPAPGFKCDSTPMLQRSTQQELKESQNDATKERETVTRRSTYRERDPRRNRSLPCRYFTPGNCHLGKDCRLSHHAKACVDLEGRSENEKLEFGQYLCNKDQLSEGPKWADKSTISGVGSSSEGKDATAWSVDQGLDHRWGSRNIIDKDPDNESKKMQVEAKKPQENCPLEKSNDAKAMVAFKFQLVEFVKVLLSPTWKQGQLSKEAYKNIVKKVADKVIATIEGPYIPRTQQKIDQYLSLSKPKIAKLVQAYVEKFQSETRS